MSGAPTVAQLLVQAASHGVDRLDAQTLLAQVLQHRREWLLAHDDAPVPRPQAQAFADGLARLAADEPLAYLLGRREFHGLELEVGPGVLVPRADTETLVDWALALLEGDLADRNAPAVIDLGCGSGAIALAVASRCPRARLTGVDKSEDALAYARRNGRHLGVTVDWRHGHWWECAPAGPFDLALSNPPYIDAQDPHLHALRHEPREALVAQNQGLADLHHLVDTTPPRLKPGAWLLLEHGWQQAAAVRSRLLARGFDTVQSRRDLAGHERCSGGRWPAV